MFNRKESIIQAIKDNSIDKNTLNLMVDFYSATGSLEVAEVEEIQALLNPVVE